MTATEPTVYGKPVGSLWRRPGPVAAGDRYELTAITDNGGLGMWVSLRRTDDPDRQVTCSVDRMGRDFVPAPTAEDDHDETCSATGVTSMPFAFGSVTGNAVPEPIKPGTTFHDVPPDDGVPLAEWEIKLRAGEQWELHFGDPVTLDGDLYRVVDADGKAILEPEPAPTPPLPWVEHPDAWWTNERRTEAYPSRNFDSSDVADAWQRVAVIPWDLIERARQYQDRADKGYEPGSSTIKAVLDAADGAR